ncbi:MAG: hypothetical protein AB1814_02080 [Thermodesulfobacteriota bacterium]
MMAKKDVTDSEIAVLMRPVHASLKKYLVRRQPTQEDEPEQAKNKPHKKSGRQGGSKSANQGDSVSGRRGGSVSSERGGSSQQSIISDEEHEYLESVYEYPNLSLTARGEKLALSADKRTRMKNSLIQRKMLVEFSVDLGSDYGGRVKMLRLTDEGCKAIGRKAPGSVSPRQGSFEHLWWQVFIANDYAARGYKVNIEKLLNGKSADIGVRKGSEIVAVEVELTPKNSLYNFKADIDAGFARVILACKNQNVKTQVEKKINAFIEDNPRYEGKARIMLLNEFPFVKSLKKEIRGC